MSGESLATQLGILQSLLESVDDAVAVVGEDGRFVLHNQAAKRIGNIRPQVTNVAEWAIQTGIPEDQLPFARALRGERVESEELFLRPTGQAEGVWFRVTAQPLMDATGERRGAIAVLRDITAHKKSLEALRQSEQRFATFMRHLPGV